MGTSHQQVQENLQITLAASGKLPQNQQIEWDDVSRTIALETSVDSANRAWNFLNWGNFESGICALLDADMPIGVVQTEEKYIPNIPRRSRRVIWKTRDTEDWYLPTQPPSFIEVVERSEKRNRRSILTRVDGITRRVHYSGKYGEPIVSDLFRCSNWDAYRFEIDGRCVQPATSLPKDQNALVTVVPRLFGGSAGPDNLRDIPFRAAREDRRIVLRNALETRMKKNVPAKKTLSSITDLEYLQILSAAICEAFKDEPSPDECMTNIRKSAKRLITNMQFEVLTIRETARVKRVHYCGENMMFIECKEHLTTSEYIDLCNSACGHKNECLFGIRGQKFVASHCIPMPRGSYDHATKMGRSDPGPGKKNYDHATKMGGTDPGPGKGKGKPKKAAIKKEVKAEVKKEVKREVRRKEKQPVPRRKKQQRAAASQKQVHTVERSVKVLFRGVDEKKLKPIRFLVDQIQAPAIAQSSDGPGILGPVKLFNIALDLASIRSMASKASSPITAELDMYQMFRVTHMEFDIIFTAPNAVEGNVCVLYDSTFKDGMDLKLAHELLLLFDTRKSAGKGDVQEFVLHPSSSPGKRMQRHKFVIPYNDTPFPVDPTAQLEAPTGMLYIFLRNPIQAVQYGGEQSYQVFTGKLGELHASFGFTGMYLTNRQLHTELDDTATPYTRKSIAPIQASSQVHVTGGSLPYPPPSGNGWVGCGLDISPQLGDDVMSTLSQNQEAVTPFPRALSAYQFQKPTILVNSTDQGILSATWSVICALAEAYIPPTGLVLEGLGSLVSSAGTMIYGGTTSGSADTPSGQAIEWLNSLWNSNKSLSPANTNGQQQPGLSSITYAPGVLGVVPNDNTFGGTFPSPVNASAFSPSHATFTGMASTLYYAYAAAEPGSYVAALLQYMREAASKGMYPTGYLNNDNLDFGPIVGEVFERVMPDGKVALSPYPHRTVLDPGDIPRTSGTHISELGNTSTAKTVHMVTRWNPNIPGPSVNFVTKFPMKVNDYANLFPAKPYMDLYAGDKTIYLYIEILPYDDPSTTVEDVLLFSKQVSRASYSPVPNLIRMMLDGCLVPYGPLDASLTTFSAEWEVASLTPEDQQLYGLPRANFRYFTDFQNAITQTHPSGRTSLSYRARFEIGMGANGEEPDFTTVRTLSHLVSSLHGPVSLSFELGDGVASRADRALLWMFAPA